MPHEAVPCGFPGITAQDLRYYSTGLRGTNNDYLSLPLSLLPMIMGQLTSLILMAPEGKTDIHVNFPVVVE